MAQEDKKILEVFTTHGAQLGIMTRMPTAEIRKEMAGGEERDPYYITIIGLTDGGDHIEVNIIRDHLSVFIIKPMPTPSQIAIPKLAM